LRWQARFFGCALRCVEKYSVKAECDHLNSLTAGLAQRAQDREWPGARDYTGRPGLIFTHIFGWTHGAGEPHGGGLRSWWFR